MKRRGLSPLAAAAAFVVLAMIPGAAQATDFRGSTGQGGKAVVATGADGITSRIDIRWVARCSSFGVRWRDATRFVGPFRGNSIRSGGTFRERSGKAVGTLRVGMRAQRVSTYRWAGTFKASVVVRRGKRVVSRCRMRRTRWAATTPHVRLSLSSQSGDYIFGGNAATFETPTDAITFKGSRAGVTAQFGNDLSGVAFGYTLEIVAPRGRQLGPGHFADARRAAFADGRPGVDVSGDGRGCNEVFGAYDVQSASFDRKGVLTAIQMTFEHHCESLSAPALTGSLYYQR